MMERRDHAGGDGQTLNLRVSAEIIITQRQGNWLSMKTLHGAA